MNMMQTMLAILITIMILRVGSVPGWVRNLVLNRLAKVVCIHTCTRVEPSRGTLTEATTMDGTHSKRGSASILETAGTQDLPTASTIACKLSPEVMEILVRAHDSSKSREQEAEIQGEWMEVARALDRLCFILFLVISVVEIAAFALTIFFY